MILCGVGLFVYALLGFEPSWSGYSPSSLSRENYGYHYGTFARIQAVAGAMLSVGGIFAYRAAIRREGPK